MFDRRQVLNTVIQSSAVDLFHSNEIAVAPLERARAGTLADLARPELAAYISFTGRGMNGGLLLCVPSAVFQLVKQDPGRPFTGADWVREQSNQLLGRIKNRLSQFQVTLSSGLPTLLTEEAFKRHAARPDPSYIFEFRTLRGVITIVLVGNIDMNVFVYSSFVSLPNEGDIIIF